MKSYIFLLLAFLVSFTPLAGTEEVTKVAPTKVVHVLTMVTPFDEHVIILKDGSAWKTHDNKLPELGDVVKSPNGSFFVNTSQEMAYYQWQSIGTIIYSPLKIDNILTPCPFDPNKDFDATFLAEIGDFSIPSGEKYFVLSNQLIYNDESFSDIDFCDWESAESLQLIRRDEIEDQEYLVCLERGEIRPVETLVYQTSKIIDVNVDDNIFILEGDDRPWHTFCSYAETMSTWDPAHLIRVFKLPELDEFREEEGIEVENIEDSALPRLFFRLQHGYEPEPTFFETGNMRSGIVMNIDTGEMVIMWDCIPASTR